VQIGLLLPNVGAPGTPDGAGRCVRLATMAETLGYDAVWCGDHVTVPAGVDLRYP
jgi:alkanesulfonate monooxygenase SsuD/methylene tetrahydromethanopterin reductase-like flavin-dependent oxidoreductase (luciferase family)